MFTGFLGYPPNAEAVNYFQREFSPRIQNGRPDATFVVVGKAPPNWLMEQARDAAVTVIGNMPDIRPHITRGAVYVVPLRAGGGTRLKVLEGLAMGQAIVSTTVGVEGIDVRDDEHLLIRDTPQAFADAVVELLSDPDHRDRLGTAGRALVERSYTWKAQAALLTAAYESVWKRERVW